MRNENGVFRARFNDRALRSIDTHKLRAEIAALHTPGNPPAIILSLRNLDSLASGSLGALAQLTADLEQIGGVLVLYAIPREIAKVIKKTKLDRIINTARDRSAARKKAAGLRERQAADSKRHYAA
ncbi:MAG: STAS domain-containing protein [Phycisphaerales bacterium]